MPIRMLLLAAVLSGLAAAIATPAAAADAIVLSSTLPAHKTGSALAEAQRIDVPKDGALRLLLPSGQTVTVTGPYQGSIGEYRAQRATRGLTQDDRSNVIGGTRGVRPETQGATR